MAANREARRRKILDRGSDRLALITGRIPNRPISDSSPPSDLQALDNDASSSSLSQPLVSDDQAPRSHVSQQITPVSCGEIEESYSVLPEHDVTDSYQSNADSSRNLAPFLYNIEEGNNEISELPALEEEQVQPPSDSSLDTLETKQESESHTQEHNLLNTTEISSAITATQSTRLICSVVGALLVVLSYLGFPLLGSGFMKSIICYRPLYLVLVTNITIVIARLLSHKQRGSERAAGRQGDDWTDHLGRTLEASFLLKNVMDSVFIECAIYAIVVITGLSILQMIGK